MKDLLKSDIRIHDADIFIGGVALSNIYINKEHLLAIGSDIDASKKNVEERLNKSTKEELNVEGEVWSTDIKNRELFNEICKSHSAYSLITKREYVAICRLENLYFSEDVIEKDSLGVLKRLKKDIDRIYGLKNICIEDIELKFYEFGNVTITGRLRAINVNMTIDEYRMLSEFVHAYFGPALRQDVIEMVNLYIDVMRDIDEDTEIELCLLKIPLDIHNNNERKKAIIEISELNALNFAIRYHFIYSTTLKNDLENGKTNFEALMEILSGEWELNLKNTVSLKDAYIYFGWTHSLLVLDSLKTINSEQLYEKFKLPLEVVLANWGTLNSLSKRLDKARAQYIKDMEDIEKSNFKKNDYTKIANDIREFTLKIERIMENFDSYTVSNNPMHYRLIDLQQEAFLEHKSIEKIRNKAELVSKIVDELSIRQKNLESERLNKMLITITLLTIIDLSNTIYGIVNGYYEHIIYTTIICTILIVILVGIYYLNVKSVFRKLSFKKYRRKKARD